MSRRAVAWMVAAFRLGDEAPDDVAARAALIAMDADVAGRHLRLLRAIRRLADQEDLGPWGYGYQNFPVRWLMSDDLRWGANALREALASSRHHGRAVWVDASVAGRFRHERPTTSGCRLASDGLSWQMPGGEGPIRRTMPVGRRVLYEVALYVAEPDTARGLLERLAREAPLTLLDLLEEGVGPENVGEGPAPERRALAPLARRADLGGLLQHEDPTVREATLEALGRLPSLDTGRGGR